MIKRFLPILILAASPTVADELTGYDICNRSEVVVGFFNGVDTLPIKALASSYEMFHNYGDTSPTGEAITYDMLYNNTNGFEDFVEVFQQRLAEHSDLLKDRIELYGRLEEDEQSWWS